MWNDSLSLAAHLLGRLNASMAPAMLFLSLSMCGHAAERPAAILKADVVIVGGTPGGIMAAIAAARLGQTVLLLERTTHIGGLPANGLGATDIHTRGATGGLFLEFVRRIHRHYVDIYGVESEQVRTSNGGYRFEPSVAERVFDQMLAEHPQISVLRKHQFDALPENVSLDGRRIGAIRVLNRASNVHESVAGRVFIDATYEGDLAAAAGVPYRLGREDSREFNEPMAGQLYKQWGGPLGPGSSGRGDNAIQSYNFRLALTKLPGNQTPVPKPANYCREEFVSLVEDIRSGRQTGMPGIPRRELEWDGIGRVINIVELPNGKTDANNQHTGFLSTDLPEENWPWPTASWEWRDRFAQRLRDYTLGLLWFCQYDPDLPETFRARCREWGLARDEYTDNGNFPRQLYVREARRITGEHIFSAHDALPTTEGGRPPVYPDSITSSHYALDSHAVRKREPDRVHLDGFFSKGSAPYTVPYRVIVPRDIDGLLVPVAASATHVGYSTLRMEPCWMALGEAAGTAAALAVQDNIEVRSVDVVKLQTKLLGDSAVLIYFRDLSPDAPYYAALQLLALRGLLSGWEARPDDIMPTIEAQKWREALQLNREPVPSTISRGEYAQAIWTEFQINRRRLR